MQKLNEAHSSDDEGLSEGWIDAVREQRWNEAALAQTVTDAHWRVWRYREPAVVLGRSQHRLVLPEGEGLLPLVKRGAGGGAVLVGPWLLSASIVLPPDDPRVTSVSVADSYRWLGEVMVAVLAELGVKARAMPPAERIAAPPELGWACFAGVAPWEVVVRDERGSEEGAVRWRKLIGFAQRRTRHGVLLALGVLMRPSPWLRLAERLGEDLAGAEVLAQTTVGLSELLPEPVPDERFLALLRPRLAPIREVGMPDGRVL
ncbi:MAG: ligase [Lautropia sp.]|nr:ligase [Lautropia sp.]